ncbi:MAG: methyltransferase domain-containing protein [Gammaproteobacteria bacterium]|nr:methyltransferase domain-containing protein [Gammaproteobacteria bacterium]
MNTANKVKHTSYQYGEEYQRKQVEKYKDRANNHWQFRIQLAHDLVRNHVVPQLGDRAKSTIIVVDVGTSIGTFALEFSKLGYKVYGVDFDEQALKIARQLAAEEKVQPEFIRADISDWSQNFPPIDIAICFDIFEHLHDDELGALLVAIRKNLALNGHLVFHTFPTQYDYLLYDKRLLRYPLYLISKLPTRMFERLLRIYAAFFDIALLLARGVDYKETIKTWSHCNPLTHTRLTDMLKRAGFDIVCIESATLYPSTHAIARIFKKQLISHRNLYGVATPKV